MRGDKSVCKREVGTLVDALCGGHVGELCAGACV